MNLREWMPIYRNICSMLAIDHKDDFLSSVKLSSLLGDRPSEIPGNFYFREVSIFGPAAIKYEMSSWKGDLTIVSDSALGQFLQLNQGSAPDIIVTDLDGSQEDVARCCENGTMTFVHAHGDNVRRIMKAVPSLKGDVIGTTQNYPLHNVFNFYGFTDGDRSAFISVMLKASRVRFFGFDFGKPQEKLGTDMQVKKLKLEIAESLVKIAEKMAIENGSSGFVFC